MSQDPGYCGNCHEEKVRARHLNIPLGGISGSTSGSLAGKAKVAKELAHPFEYEDESHCANINCTNGQTEIFDEIHRINKGLNHAARTGDWTKIDKEDLDRLEQLSERANEVEDVADIEWLDNNKTEEWEGIRDEIDKFEDNRNEAIERTAKVDDDPNRRVQGKDRTPENEDILDNLYELRNGIYIQEIVSDHVNRISGRSNEQEVVADKDTSITENQEDEQQERDEVSKEALQAKIEELEAENKDLEAKNEDLNTKLDDRDETIEELEKENEELEDEKIELINEKQDLMDKVQGLTDDKMGLVDEKQELSEENLDLKEEVQNLKAKIQQLENERESEAEVEATPERASDGTGKGAAEGVETGGSRAAGEDREERRSSSREERSSSSSRAQPDDSRTQAADNGSNGGSRDSDAILGDPIPEEYEKVFGKPMPEEYRNGGPTTNNGNGVDREDDRNERRRHGDGSGAR